MRCIGSVPALAVGAALAVAPVDLRAETDFGLVGREMAGMLQNRHYARLSFNAELSARMLDNYLDDLDPARLYFTEKDVAAIRKEYGGRLHELLLRSRCMEAARNVYASFVNRVVERAKYVGGLLEDEPMFFAEEGSVLISRAKVARPANDAALRELWKRQLENELLSENLRRELARRKSADGEGAVKTRDLSAEEKVLLGYDRFRRSAESATEEDIADYFLSAVASTYDPHTDYMSMRDNERFQARMTNGLVGIGVTLRSEDDGTVRVEAIVINGPADKEGNLELNDRIIAIDPANKGGDGDLVDILYAKTDRVVEMVKGKKGTKVRLKIRPADAVPGMFKTVVIERGQVEYKDQLARAELVISKDVKRGEPRVGYLQIPSFYYDFEDGDPSVSRDVEKLLRRLEIEKIDGLVIDLRGNGGGALHEVIRIAGFLLGARPVLQVKHSSGKVETKSAELRRPIYTGPLVLLTNKASASASEILAGVLQDYNRAVVVGDSSTYGKGTVQQQLDIGRYFPVYEDSRRAGSLKPTIQKYYRVSGSSVQLVGVRSDIILPSSYDAYEFGEAFQRGPLRHDTIAKSKKFVPLDESKLFRDRLLKKSTDRIAGDKDFSYLREDIERIKADRERNTLALNRETRLGLIDEKENRRKERNAERRARFQSVEELDAAMLEVLELTLADASKTELTKITRDNPRTVYTRRAADEIEGPGDAPGWPSGIDPSKREALAIAMDLIEMTEASRVAKKDPNS